jgi:hypothetical protein
MLANPETRELFTFPTSSMGGRKALDKLCRAYGREQARHRDEWPVIELQVDSYASKSFGRIKFPVFKIVDWVSKDADSSAAPGAPAPPPNSAAAMVAPPLSDLGEPPPYEPDDPRDYDPLF